MKAKHDASEVVPRGAMPVALAAASGARWNKGFEGCQEIAGKTAGGRARLISLFDRDANNAGSRHAERPGCANRQIDHPPSHEGTTVIDAALHRTAPVANSDDASEWPGSVRTGHPVAAASII
jgi:hypothetical protein